MTFEEILARITVDDKTGCWQWQGAHLPNGYGSVRYDGRSRVVHKVLWEHANNTPVPKGLQLDHLCRNRGCCNPQHLEAVTQETNLLRGYSPPAINARKTACPRGHKYDRVDTRGYRECSICKKFAGESTI